MTDKDEIKKEAARHILRFLVIGGASVATDGFFYWLLASRFSLPFTPAKGISYILGMILGFAGNKFWTFESARKTAEEPLSYLVLYAGTLCVNMAVNLGVLLLLENTGPGLRMSAFAGMEAGRFAKIIAFFAATGTTTVLNFLGLRFITFRQGILERRSTQ